MKIRFTGNASNGKQEFKKDSKLTVTPDEYIIEEFDKVAKIIDATDEEMEELNLISEKI